jgi:tape measure domain-containing protein
MGFKSTVTEFIIKGRDLFSPAANKAEKEALRLAETSEKLNQQLNNVEGLQKNISSYEQLKKALKQNDVAYKESALSLGKLEQEQAKVKTSSKQYARDIKSTEEALIQLNKEQKQAGTESQKFDQAIQEQTNKLKQLEQQQEQATEDKIKYSLEVKKSRSEVNQLSSSIVKNTKEFEKLEKSLTAAGKDLNNLGDESAKLASQQNAAKVAISQTNNKLSKQEKQLKHASKSAKQYKGDIAGATKSLLAMGSAYIGLDSLKDSLFDVLKAGDKAQAFTAQMTAMMGSIEAGEQATQWMRTFASDTGTQIDSVRESFAQLKTFGIDPMSGAMQSLVDYNAKLGGSQEKLEGIVLAVGQAWAKQKLQGEEILQLVERGVPVWDLLAKVTGKNSVELQKLSESGKLGRETIKALFDEMGAQASGQASKSLERLSGQVALITNKWEEFQIKIADSGVYQVAVDFLKQINAQFDQMNQNGQIDAAAKKISAFFTAIVQDGGQAISSLVENVNTVLTVTEQVIGGVRILINGFTAGIKTIALGVTTYMQDMVQTMADALAFVGADEWAQKAQYQADAFRAVSQGFHSAILEDGQDLTAAWQQLTQTGQDNIKATHQASTEAVKKSTQAQTQAVESAALSQAQSADAAALKSKQAADELNLYMSKAGITTTALLQEQANEAQAVFDTLQAKLKTGEVGIYEVEQAYNMWSVAAIKVAEATNSGIPPILKAKAATLGLTSQLEALIKKSVELAPATDNNSDAVNRFTAQLDKTKAAIEKNVAILNSSTASAKLKAQAQEALNIQQERLVSQTDALNKVQELEASNVFKLRREQQSLNESMVQLNNQYEYGYITTQEYNRKKAEMADLLAVTNNLLGDFKHKQDDATAATRRGTDATKSATQASKENSKSLRQQKDELDKVSVSARQAATSVASVNQASVGDIVDYQEKNQNAYDIDSKEIQREKEKRNYEAANSNQFNQFEAAVDNSGNSITELNALYNKINKQLNYLTKEQRSTLNQTINAKKQAINNNKRSSNNSNSNQRQSAYTPSSYQAPKSNYQSNDNADVSKLTSSINDLIRQMKLQPRGSQNVSSSQPSKTVRLELMIGGEMFKADILAEFEEQFLTKLEQLQQVS